MLPDLSLFSPAHLPHQDSHGENNITRGTYDTNGPMPVLSLAKKVVKGMKASPVRVGEGGCSSGGRAASQCTAFLSLIGCVNLVSWLLLATAGVSLTQPLREICAVEYSLLARRKTILHTASAATHSPWGQCPAGGHLSFPFPLTLQGWWEKGRVLGYVNSPTWIQRKPRRGITQPRTCLFTIPV